MSDERKDQAIQSEIESFNDEPMDASEMTPEELEQASGGTLSAEDEAEGDSKCKIHVTCFIN